MWFREYANQHPAVREMLRPQDIEAIRATLELMKNGDPDTY